MADPDAVEQLEEILELNLADDTQSWSLDADGTWHRIPTVLGIATQEALEVAALERSSLLDEPRRSRRACDQLGRSPGRLSGSRLGGERTTDPRAVTATAEATRARGGRRRARRMAWLYTAAAVMLLPWIVYLAVTLPRRHFDRHYRVAWVGFDILLVIAIVRTAYFAFRVDPTGPVPGHGHGHPAVRGRLVRRHDLGGPRQFFEAVVLAVWSRSRPRSSPSTWPAGSIDGSSSWPTGRSIPAPATVAAAATRRAGASRSRPRPSRRPARSDDDGVDARQHVVGQPGHDLQGGQVLVDLLDPAGPGDDGRDVRVLGAPGDGQLGQGAVELLGDVLCVSAAATTTTTTTTTTANWAALAGHGCPTGTSGLTTWVPVGDEQAVVSGLLQRGWAVSPGDRFRMASPTGIRITVSTLDVGEAPGLADALADCVGQRAVRTD